MIVPIKTLKVDTLTIHVYNSRQDMGIAAYELYKKHVRELMARQKIVRAIFAAAHSQDDFLKALAEDTEIDLLVLPDSTWMGTWGWEKTLLKILVIF